MWRASAAHSLIALRAGCAARRTAAKQGIVTSGAYPATLGEMVSNRTSRVSMRQVSWRDAQARPETAEAILESSYGMRMDATPRSTFGRSRGATRGRTLRGVLVAIALLVASPAAAFAHDDDPAYRDGTPTAGLTTAWDAGPTDLPPFADDPAPADPVAPADTAPPSDPAPADPAPPADDPPPADPSPPADPVPPADPAPPVEPAPPADPAPADPAPPTDLAIPVDPEQPKDGSIKETKPAPEPTPAEPAVVEPVTPAVAPAEPAAAPADPAPVDPVADPAATGTERPAHAFQRVMVQLGIQSLATAQDLATHTTAPAATTCATVDASGTPVSGSSTVSASAEDAKAQRLADRPQTVRGPPAPFKPPVSPVSASAAAPAASASAGIVAVTTLTSSFTVPLTETDSVIPADPCIPAGPAASCHAARAPPVS